MGTHTPYVRRGVVHWEHSVSTTSSIPWPWRHSSKHRVRTHPMCTMGHQGCFDRTSDYSDVYPWVTTLRPEFQPVVVQSQYQSSRFAGSPRNSGSCITLGLLESTVLSTEAPLQASQCRCLARKRGLPTDRSGLRCDSQYHRQAIGQPHTTRLGALYEYHR